MQQFQDARYIEDKVFLHKKLNSVYEDEHKKFLDSGFNEVQIAQELKLSEMPSKMSSDPRKVLTLSGPLQFTFYKNIDGRKLLLLGEQHDNSKLCSGKSTPVANWLYNLAINTMKKNEFEESNYNNGIISNIASINEKSFSSPLQQIRKTFQLCNITNGSTVCPINELRYHLIDPRLGFNTLKNFPLFNMIVDYVNKNFVPSYLKGLN